ncbi:MAG: FtsX-like permease family protein [Spirochaetales bacterium]|nr:FtsX-like permease family protein [Spirochaetales bacterium]
MLRNFRVISKISLRNLVRQRRRNILLGVCITIMMSILVVTTSFTNGLTDIIFNKLMLYITGHIRVSSTESTSSLSRVTRDTPRLIELIKENVADVQRIDETISVFGRAIGNRKTALLMLIGATQSQGEENSGDFVIDAGDFNDIFKEDLYPGVVLFKNTAKELNVKLNDLIYVKFETIYKQPQSPALKVVGIIRSENMFMDMAALMDIRKLKTFLNMKAEESMGLNVVVNHPGDRLRTILSADRLYAALKPEAAGVKASLTARGKRVSADVFALKVKSDAAARKLAGSALVWRAGGVEALQKDTNTIALSASTAEALGVRAGDKILYSYTPKYVKDQVERELAVAGVFDDPAGFKPETAFAPDTLFYETYYRNLPKEPAAAPKTGALEKALLPEWELLPRTADTESSMKKMQELTRTKWDGTKIDVSTMYETGSMVLDMSVILNGISFAAVFILFIISIIGIMNTMRMTIRERTREIGTNRAIGMQRGAVRNVFVFEVLYLSLFACVVGTILGFGLIALFRLFTFDMSDNAFGMFLVKQHLYFLPSAFAIVFCFLFINGIALLVAFLTARRAANLRVADALRHYE